MRRSRLAYLPIAFPLLAFAEIMTFLAVAHAIGTGWALFILVVATIAGFAQVAVQSSQVGADVRIDLGAAAGGPSGVDVVTLVAFVLGDLDAGEFDFA